MEKNKLNNNKHNFYAISLSYEKAEAKIRGKFSFPSDLVESFCDKINLFFPTTKLFILSTCNRTELYIQSESVNDIITLFCQHIHVPVEDYKKYISVYKEQDAISHFLRVSAGLESQILGDFEIIGQVKTWFKRFKKHHTTNAFLERLINTGIQTSKKIKSTTALSNGATSMSYAAVHYILNNYSQLSDKKIALIGIGKIGRNTCENLLKHIKKPQITLLNRTFTKAKEMADAFNLQVKDYSELHTVVNESDIVIVSTGAPFPIIRKENFIPNKSVTLIDLSIPANISVSLKDFPQVTLLNVDDLSQIINKTFEQRNKEIPKAEAIIKEMMKEFIIWVENRKYVPVIHAFKNDLERIKDYQVKTLKKDQIEVSNEEIVLSEKVVQKITNKLANYLIKNPEKADDTIGLFKEMFQLQISNF